MVMQNVSENVIQMILKRHFNSLVGKSCKRFEILRDTKELSPETSFNLSRDLVKELAYETMRDILTDISAYAQGVSIDVKLNKPISK